MTPFPVFGKAPDGPRLQRIRNSPNYRSDRFQNLVPTELTRKDASIFRMMLKFFRRPAETMPDRPVPSTFTDLRSLADDKVSIVWFGHSSYLLKVGKTHILVDPVFSRNASPFSIFAAAFPGTEVYDVNSLPDAIDIVLLTHDHFDHLDYKTILQLAPRTRRFCASLGVGAHLEYWGVPAEKISELDWWESCRIGDDRSVVADEASDIILTATPARHFSGRSIKRNNTLWSSFVVKAGGYTLFLGGDSGYEQHFKEIGQRVGAFDIAVLECGQYGENWPDIHMLPEQTVQAAQDLHAKWLLPVHWSKFALAFHPWNEPIRRVTLAAAKAGQPITTPLIGQPVILNQHYPNSDWWDFA